MCGITGAIWTSPAWAIDRDTLARMTRVLRHRGPDEEGMHYVDGCRTDENGSVGVALGHRRLSIIGLSDGQQPLSNENDTVWVVFNGEIYNYGPLRDQLAAIGHRFRTHTDTEVLVHAYEEWGVDMLERLNGMFAFAIWDARRRRVILARDRLGQKPLYYRHEQGRLIFASELKSIVTVDGVPRQVNPRAIDAYLLYQYVPHPMTIYDGIDKLAPGCCAIFEDDRLDVQAYWTPDFQRETVSPSKDAPPSRNDRRSLAHGEAWSDALEQSLTDAVRLRMQSEVPLGAFLSGGIDSSIIVGLMTELTDQKVRTFSIGSKVKEYDESNYAREVAKHLGTEHEEFYVEAEALDILPKLVWHYDEPFADSSAIPTWCVSEMTRRHVTVALSGDGGDELFIGYPRYKAIRIGQCVDLLPRGVRKAIGHSVWQRLPSNNRRRSFMRRLKRLMEGIGQDSLERYSQWIAIFNSTRRAGLYTDDFAEALGDVDALDFWRREKELSAGRDEVTSTALLDLRTYLPCDLNCKVDIASMAHSLECRQPFLDHRVVELAARMPVEYKFRKGQGKRILIETFKRFLPESVQTRAKMGFGVPIDHWFRGPLADFTRDTLLSRRAIERGWFKEDVVSTMIDDHTSGTMDHAYRLWALLVLELWCREWVDA